MSRTGEKRVAEGKLAYMDTRLGRSFGRVRLWRAFWQHLVILLSLEVRSLAPQRRKPQKDGAAHSLDSNHKRSDGRQRRCEEGTKEKEKVQKNQPSSVAFCIVTATAP